MIVHAKSHNLFSTSDAFGNGVTDSSYLVLEETGHNSVTVLKMIISLNLFFIPSANGTKICSFKQSTLKCLYVFQHVHCEYLFRFIFLRVLDVKLKLILCLPGFFLSHYY